MTTLEITLTVIMWILYGTFNAKQHDFYDIYDQGETLTFFNILFAPIALLIRIFRGVFIWEGQY